MSKRKWSAALLAALACAKVSTVDDAADAGPSQPTVSQVEPQPGPVPGTAKFVVHFSSAMDEGQLLAKDGRSETVALATEADVERAAAALEHGNLSAHERSLLVPAAAEVAADRQSLTLIPDQPLPAGTFYLLVSPRLKDDQGRKLAGNGARFGYQVAPPAVTPHLISPAAGADAPTNLGVVRAFAPAGKLALLDPDGNAVSSADAKGETALALQAPLAAGARYVLSLDGVAAPDQSFTAADCARKAAPAFEGGAPQLTARDGAVEVSAALDWPALLEVKVGRAADGEPCKGSCTTAKVRIDCSPPACGPQTFACRGSLRVSGLDPATSYSLRATASDDEGFVAAGPLQSFTTLAALPRVILSEVMPTPPAAGEYVELFNQGPGAADLATMALLGPDGIVRPLMASAPPLPVLLEPGGRALAVGNSFDSALYPSMPPATPVLRGKTKRLLGHGLHRSPPAFRLVLQGAVPVELSNFPGSAPQCPAGTSLQRDESAPPDAEARWDCGKAGGTPGAPP